MDLVVSLATVRRWGLLCSLLYQKVKFAVLYYG